MNVVIAKIKNNPALVVGFITAVIGVAVTLGVDISDELKAGIIGVVTAGLAFVTRANVTPV